jgi:hypothetical protein
MWLADEVERLRVQRDELAECIDAIGWTTWQTAGHGGMTWRDHKVGIWQHAATLVGAVEEAWQIEFPREEQDDL